MPLQVAISFIGNLLMNTNNQRRMQMNSTSRPCSTRHEIIKTIPTLRLQLQTNFILRATLSGVPRGRPSVRVVVTTTAAPIYCVHSATHKPAVNFRQLKILCCQKKKYRKIETTTQRRMQQKGAVEMAADSQEMAFFVRTDRTEKSRPVVTLLLLLLLSNGADGGTKRKNYKPNISVQRTRTERNVMQPSAKDEGLWQFDEIPPIRLHFHLVLLSLQRHNVRVFRKFS